MNRRVLLSTLLAGSATAVMAPAAFGAAAWCDDDPLVNILTPDGKVLPVHVTNYALGEENRVYLDRVPDNQTAQNAWIGWSVLQSKKGGKKPSSAPAGATLWDITIRVTIHTDPGDGKRFRTKTVVSSLEYAKGEIYDEAQGVANRQMELRFSLWA